MGADFHHRIPQHVIFLPLIIETDMFHNGTVDDFFLAALKLPNADRHLARASAGQANSLGIGASSKQNRIG